MKVSRLGGRRVKAERCLLVVDDREGWRFKGDFFKHLDRVNADLAKAGLPALQRSKVVQANGFH